MFEFFWYKIGCECFKFFCKWYDFVVENVDDFVIFIIWENGKFMVDVKGEVIYVVNFFEWFSEEVFCIYGDIIFFFILGNCVIIIKELVGVCGLIILWNFFVVMIICKIGFVLVVGCLVVVKVFGEIFFILLVFVEFVYCVGVFLGVVNVVMVSENIFEVGKEFIINFIVCKIFFIGLILVGKLFMK